MAGKKILIADDEARLRKLVSDYLVREGYEVLEAADGEQALDIFYQEKDLALMILDVMMPGVDGFMVCKEVRETSQIPIVMLTAKSEENDIFQNHLVRKFWLHMSMPSFAERRIQRMRIKILWKREEFL